MPVCTELEVLSKLAWFNIAPVSTSSNDKYFKGLKNNFLQKLN